MAISFRHDAAGIGGNGAGGDSRRKFGQALVLQQQRFAQDNAQRAQDRMFDLGRMRLADQFQFARDQRMIQADRDLLAARQEAENQQFMQRRKLQQEDMDAAIQRGMVQDSTRFVEGRVADVRGMLAKQQYTPEGQKIYGDLFGALRSIEAQRDTIRPKEYNALLNKWLDNAERSGLEKFVAAPPTIDEELGGRFKDLGTGYGVFMQPDGKVEVREIDPAKIEGAKGNASSMSAAEYFANDSKYEAGKKKALQSMQERYLADNPNATSAPSFSAEKIHDQMLKDFNEHQKFLQQLGSTGGGNQSGSPPVNPAAPAVSTPSTNIAGAIEPPTGAGNDTVSSPSPVQPERPPIVFEETGSPRMPMPENPLSRTAAENFRRNLAGMYSGPRDENGRVTDASAQDLANALGKDPGTKRLGVDNVTQDLMGPEAMKIMREQYGSENPEQDLQNFWTDYLNPPMPKERQGFKVNELRNPIDRTQGAMLPRPGSAAEMVDMVKSGKLKPGDMFIAPDGTMHKYSPET